MILPNLAIPEFQNLILDKTGYDYQWQTEYLYPVSYRYNSRGFRDQEWPTELCELQNSVWCIGDSFTVGVGSVVTHTWPNILQRRINRRCINVSMDGASNYWIARKAVEILNEIHPNIMILHWSYFHRGELDDPLLSDLQRRLHFLHKHIVESDTELLNNFSNLVHLVEQAKGHTNVVHSFIPQGPVVYSNYIANQQWNSFAGSSWPAIPTTIGEFAELPDHVKHELKKFNEYSKFKTFVKLGRQFDELMCSLSWVPELKQLDFARDAHHYDIVTAKDFVEKLMNVVVRLRSQ